MAQKNVNVDIILNGRIGSGVDSLTNRIQQIGQLINTVSAKVADWEKESVGIYRNYETYMLEAKAAMRSNYDSASDLEKAYNTLWTQSQKWAATTIFHTNDVSKAIAEAAHAGWELDKMLEGIPSAMLLAQAGNIDLSSGLDYLIKVLNGTGTAFEDSGKLVDEWVTAANSSATTVSELGAALEKMGATARLGDSNAELLTLLATLADAGSVGQQAGTLLRNGMIRLVAPTDKANAALKVLGATTEEIEEALSDKSVVKAAKEIEALGVSAYDATTGELRPMIDVFRDLYDATKDLTDERKYQLLSAIFPTRTITGALTILEAMEHIDELYNKISNSEGAAQRASDTMMSGLMGSQERFISKWEEFERKFGETVSGPLERIYDFAGGIVDKLNDLDEPTMSALAGALTSLAALGPAMLAGSGIVKAVELLGVKGTFMVAAVVGAGALYGYLSKMNEIALKNNFGTMAIDMDAINTALSNTRTQLDSEFEGFAKYSAGVKQAVQDYTDAGTYLSENLWTTMVTGTEFDPKDENDPTVKKLRSYGEKMIEAVNDGIDLATARNMELATLLYGTEEGEAALAENPVYRSIISLLNVGYTEAKRKAAELSKELREAMTSAFKDGKLDAAEIESIQKIMDELNDLVAGLSPADIELEKTLRKSQRVGLDAMKGFTDEVIAQKNAALEGFDDDFDELYATLKVYYDWAVEHGQQFYDPDTGEMVDPSKISFEDLIAETEARYKEKRTIYGTKYDKMLIDAWQNALTMSDMGGLYGEFEELIDKYMSGMLRDSPYSMLYDTLTGREGYDQLQQSLNILLKAFGGVDSVENLIKNYRLAGDEVSLANADWLEKMLLIQGITDTDNMTEERIGIRKMVDALYGEAVNKYYNGTLWYENYRSDPGYYRDIFGIDYEKIRETYENLTKAQKNAWDAQVSEYEKNYDLGAIADEYGGWGMDDEMAKWYGAYLLSSNAVRAPETYTLKNNDGTTRHERHVEAARDRAMQNAQDELAKQQAALDKLNAEGAALDKQIGETETRMKNRAYGLFDGDGYHRDWKTLNGVNGDGTGLYGQKTDVDIQIEEAQAQLEELQKQIKLLEDSTIALEVDGDTTKLEMMVDEQNKQALLEYVDGDTTKLHLKIYSQNGVLLKEIVDGDVEKLKQAIDGQNGRTIYVNIESSEGKPGFAFGGRATEASIFGEAGPEWAIPEEHSQRTAYLLNQARQASGFSWSELLSRYGGLNAGRTVSVNIGSYAPVIHATDAAGVEQKLIEDKKRLADVVKAAVKKALDEMGLRDEVEVYA